MKKLFIETYGCQMNVADSEVVASVMQMAGYELYSFKIAYFGCEINKFKLYLQTSQRISTFRYISHSNRTKLLFYRH